MMPPKVLSVQALDNYQLLVEFCTHEKRQYNVKPLLSNDMFSALKNIALFKSVKVEQGGYAVSWNENIDISEYELWRNSQCINNDN